MWVRLGNIFCNHREKQFCLETVLLWNRRHQGEFCATVISLLYFVLFPLPSWKELLKWLIILIMIIQAGAFPSLQLGKFVICSGVSLIKMREETGSQLGGAGEHWCSWRSQNRARITGVFVSWSCLVLVSLTGKSGWIACQWFIIYYVPSCFLTIFVLDKTVFYEKNTLWNSWKFYSRSNLQPHFWLCFTLADILRHWTQLQICIVL